MQLMRLAGWILAAMFGGAVALIGQHFIFPVPKVVTGQVAIAEAVAPGVPTADAPVVPSAPLLDPSAARIITLETLAASGIRSQVIRQGRQVLAIFQTTKMKKKPAKKPPNNSLKIATIVLTLVPQGIGKIIQKRISLRRRNLTLVLFTIRKCRPFHQLRQQLTTRRTRSPKKITKRRMLP